MSASEMYVAHAHQHFVRVQLMDMLVEQTHELRYEWRNNERPLRFTDVRVDEQARGISLKSTPMSLVLGASSGKSFVMNLIDTPGTHFLDHDRSSEMIVVTVHVASSLSTCSTGWSAVRQEVHK